MGGGHMSPKRFRKAPLPFMARAYQLRGGITRYGAVYVALAGEIGCSVAALDARLARARPSMPDPCPLKLAVPGDRRLASYRYLLRRWGRTCKTGLVAYPRLGGRASTASRSRSRSRIPLIRAFAPWHIAAWAYSRTLSEDKARLNPSKSARRCPGLGDRLSGLLEPGKDTGFLPPSVRGGCVPEKG